MPCIIPETDRAAELEVLRDERRVASKRYSGGRKKLARQLAQIDRDIARNRKQLRRESV